MSAKIKNFPLFLEYFDFALEFFFVSIGDEIFFKNLHFFVGGKFSFSIQL